MEKDLDVRYVRQRVRYHEEQRSRDNRSPERAHWVALATTTTTTTTITTPTPTPTPTSITAALFLSYFIPSLSLSVFTAYHHHHHQQIMTSFGGSAAAWDTPPFQASSCSPRAHPCLYATPAFSGTLHLHSAQPDTAGVRHWQLGAPSVAVVWVAPPLRLPFPLPCLF